MSRSLALIICVVCLSLASEGGECQTGAASSGPKKKFHEVYASELDKQTRELFSFGFKCRFVLDYDNPMCVKCCQHDDKVPMKGKLDNNCECVNENDPALQVQSDVVSPVSSAQAPVSLSKGPMPLPMPPPEGALRLKPVGPPPPPPPPPAPVKK